MGRALREQGHEVRLIPAQFVRPFVKSNKNDYRDAEAIAEAVERENMRFVPIKTEDTARPASPASRARPVSSTTDQSDQSDSSLPAGTWNNFSQGAGQPASADARALPSSANEVADLSVDVSTSLGRDVCRETWRQSRGCREAASNCGRQSPQKWCRSVLSIPSPDGSEEPP